MAAGQARFAGQVVWVVALVRQGTTQLAKQLVSLESTIPGNYDAS